MPASTANPDRQSLREFWRVHRNALAAERRRTLTMAIPLIGAQLLAVGNGVIDTLVAGRLGRLELAASGVGSSIWFLVFLGGIGLMAGLSPTMARLIGQKRAAGLGGVFQQGVWLSLLLGLIAMAVLLGLTGTIHRWGFEAPLVAEMRHYLTAVVWSLPPAMLILAARNVCEASGRTRPVLAVQAIGLVVNLLADLGFGLGYFGLPAFGLAGIGLATALVNVVMCAALYALLTGPRFRRYRLFTDWQAPDWRQLAALLTLSIPISLTLLFEVGLFSATAIQMGQLGALEASAHNVAVGVSALVYMLPLGLGFALTARVGVAFGRRQITSIRLRVVNGLILTLIMATSSALMLLLFRHWIPTLYTDDTEVQQLAAQLLLLAAVFQFSDDFQGTLVPMLRGLHDTRIPMVINGFSYWVAGFGTGYVTTQYLGWGPYGLWVGLIAGLTTSATLQGWRLRQCLRRLAREPARFAAGSG